MFTDGKIVVRRYQEDDTPLLYEAVRESYIELHDWMPWCHPGYGLKDSSDWVMSRGSAWEKGEEYSFVITDAATGAFLGGVGIDQIIKPDLVANLGY